MVCSNMFEFCFSQPHKTSRETSGWHTKIALQIECIVPEVSTDITRLESRFQHSWKGVEETPQGSSRTELIEVFTIFYLELLQLQDFLRPVDNVEIYRI